MLKLVVGPPGIGLDPFQSYHHVLKMPDRSHLNHKSNLRAHQHHLSFVVKCHGTANRKVVAARQSEYLSFHCCEADLALSDHQQNLDFEPSMQNHTKIC